MILKQSVQCPHCGVTFNSAIDISAEQQQYNEQCRQCHASILLTTQLDHNGRLICIEIGPLKN